MMRHLKKETQNFSLASSKWLLVYKLKSHCKKNDQKRIKNKQKGTKTATTRSAGRKNVPEQVSLIVKYVHKALRDDTCASFIHTHMHVSLLILII